LWSSIVAKPATAGFTLIEVLAALSIVAGVLAPIGALIASTARGARSIESHLTHLEIARAVFTALPNRDRLVPQILTGETAGHPWRIEVLPFEGVMSPQTRMPWLPQTIVLTVGAPMGNTMQVSTVRLRRSGG
jgi:general secretion pathway protein I